MMGPTFLIDANRPAYVQIPEDASSFVWREFGEQDASWLMKDGRRALVEMRLSTRVHAAMRGFVSKVASLLF